MIDDNTFGLGGFNLVPSSEAGMLVAIRRAIKRKKWIVFLGWEPHPMNVKHDIAYLKGGDTIFGPNYGSARVFTAVAPNYLTRCPNAGRLVRNLTFTTDIENHVMVAIMDKTEPNEAAMAWLKKHPQVLNKWLAGVTTFDGKTDGLAAVKAYLAKH
jgi:glycine betaine/proline transport system substrate-binding protein